MLQVTQAERKLGAAQAESAEQVAAAQQDAERTGAEAVSQAVAAAKVEAQEGAQRKADVRVAKLKKQLQLQNTELDSLQDEVIQLRTDLTQVR
jgi:hypothetical protein